MSSLRDERFELAVAAAEKRHARAMREDDQSEHDQDRQRARPIRLPPCRRDRERHRHGRAPGAGTQPRANLETVLSRREQGVAHLARNGRSPFVFEPGQADLILDQVLFEIRQRRE